MEIMNFKEILEMPAIKPTKCGNWEYDEKNIQLINKKVRNNHGYDVDLEEITTEHRLLDWILHIHSKTEDYEAGNFTKLLIDVIYFWFNKSPQAVFYGKERQISWKKEKYEHKEL